MIISKTSLKDTSKKVENIQSEDKSSKSFGRLKTAIFWIILIVLVTFVAFFRYGYQSFFPEPLIISDEYEDDYRPLSREGSFVVEFNQRMRKQTVGEALSIVPSVPYDLIWSGKTLMIKPQKILNVGDIYNVSINSTAKSFFGNSLLKSYYLTYQVLGDPEIVKIFPEGKSISTKDKIIIMFSHPMVKTSQIGKDIIHDSLEITPKIKGYWKWYDSKTIVFDPLEEFTPSTSYKLHSSRKLVTLDANEIKKNINLEFETERIELIKVNDSEESKDNSETLLMRVDSPLVLSFNQELDTRSLEKNLLLRNSKGEDQNNLKISAQEDSRGVYQVHNSNDVWSYNETYDLFLGESIASLQGNLDLGADRTIKFRTESLIIVDDTIQDFDNKIYIPFNDDKFDILFKKDVDIEKIKQSVRFVPEANYEISSMGGNNYTISTPLNSQKRESIQLVFTEDINDEKTKYIDKQIELTLNKPKPFMVTIVEGDEQVVFTSSNELAETSRAELLYLEKTRRLLLEQTQLEDEEINTTVTDTYQYFLSKQFLEPDNENQISLKLKDVYGQTFEKNIIASTRVLRNDEYLLRRIDKPFYIYEDNRDNLNINYESKNVSLVNIVICKLDAELAVKIETTYQERWFTFFPTIDKCQRYKSNQKEVDPLWGEIQNHTINLDDMVDDITPGIFYVHFSAPLIIDEKGQALEDNALVQYSNINVYSKRGDSSLIWATDKEYNALEKATIHLFSNEGKLLKTGETDKDGVFFLEKNKLKYEYLLVSNSDEELLLSVFEQEGYKPTDFGISFNADESKYHYKFYVEDPKNNSNEINGVFVIKDSKNDKLIPPGIPNAVVALYDNKESLLWRQYEDFDKFGNIFFSIRPRYPLLNGDYSLNICLGLHDGVCHGTSFWTNFTKGISSNIEQEYSSERTEENDQQLSSIIMIDTAEEYQVGDMLNFELQNLSKEKPVLVTIERDKIFYREIFYPEDEQKEIDVEVSLDMIPEVVVSVVQFTEGDNNYDMKAVKVSRSQKTLSLSKAVDSSYSVLINDSEKVNDYSQIVFNLNSPYLGDPNSILQIFYPRLGTSIVTASNMANQNKVNESDQMLYSSSIVGDIEYIDGKIVHGNIFSSENNDYHHLYVLHDNQGNFGGAQISPIESNNEFALSVDMVPIIRESDQPLVTLTIVNNSKKSINANLNTQSNGLEFLTGENIFFGLPSSQHKEILIPTRADFVKDNVSVGLTASLYDGDELVAIQNKDITVDAGKYLEKNKNMLTYQSNLSKGSIIIPSLNSGFWYRKTYISSTPISFILENLKRLLEKDALSMEELIFNISTAVDYSDLLKNSLTAESNLDQLLSDQSKLQTELVYLRMNQMNDGGWSKENDSLYSNSGYTSRIAKALAVLNQQVSDLPSGLVADCKEYLKAQLDERVNQRIRDEKEIVDLSQAEMFEEIQLLNALSSLTPSGVQYANNWYLGKEHLPNEALVLLLLTFEDFRDAGISGVSYKIEELIQLIKNKRTKIKNQIWLEKNLTSEISTTSFLVSSWYLEALVRQQSAHSDIPDLINWLVEKKYQLSYQTSYQQYVFLQSMASYLRIFQETISAQELDLVFSPSKKEKIIIDQDSSYQSFFIQDYFIIEEDQETPPIIKYNTDSPQALFIEISWERAQHKSNPSSNILSAFNELDVPEDVEIGEIISGSIFLVSPQEFQDVVVVFPLPANSKIAGLNKSDTAPWRVHVVDNHELIFLYGKLEAGENIIPYQLEVTHRGIYTIPPIHAYVAEQPEIYAISQAREITIK